VTEVSAAGLLALWERVATEPPGRRASVLLSWAAPDADPAGVTVGEENDKLLRLYQRAFGGALSGVVDCPACGEPLEVTVGVAQLIGGLAGAGAGAGEQLYESILDGHLLRYRVPSALDLTRPPDSGRWLLEACLTEAVGPDGSPLGAGDLPDSVVASLEQAMADLDPGAELGLDLSCPACDREWSEFLDPVEFLSIEVEARAREAVEAVQALATAYGWSEAEILALSPWRMRLYLTTAGQ